MPSNSDIWKVPGRLEEATRRWLAGESMPKIAAAMGWSRGMLAVSMDRYREQGYDLPYRYKVRGKFKRCRLD